MENDVIKNLDRMQEALDLVRSTLEWGEVTSNKNQTLQERISLHLDLLQAELEEREDEKVLSLPWYKEAADVIFVDCQYRYLCSLFVDSPGHYPNLAKYVWELATDRDLLDAYRAVVFDNWTKVITVDELFTDEELQERCEQIQQREDKKNPGRYKGIYYEYVKSNMTGNEYIVFRDSIGKVLKPLSYDGHHVAKYAKDKNE